MHQVSLLRFLKEMELNSKWDWENLVAFGSKAKESPKNLQLADWTMVDDDGDTFNLSGASDGDGSTSSHPSSAKSYVSASTDSSCKDENGNGNGNGIFRSSGNLSTKQLCGAPDTASSEALLGLKLGKRTYFENSSFVAKTTSFLVMLTPPTTITPNKTKSSSAHNSSICCQVKGCNVDLLSLAKEYHQKHRVCDTHSKCPKVIVGGRARRFCQQCSRFHSLAEFDENKRSCRRRLSDHNARRRKPHQETIQFNSPGLSTPFYGGTQQMSFVLNNSAVVHSRIPATSGWNNFTPAKGCSIKFEGDGVIDEQLHMQGIRLPQPINMLNGLSASKDTPSVVFNPGSKGSLISSSIDAAEYGRALSLLSSNSWDESSIQLHHHQLHENSSTSNISIHRQLPMIYEGVPSASSEFWPTPHNVQSLAAFKSSPSPYDVADTYSNLLN